MSDPLEDLLTPAPPPPDEALRLGLLARTTRELRRRRRARRLGAAGVLAACAAGVLLAVCAPPPVEETTPTRPAGTIEAAEPEEPRTPVALEWRALEQPDDAARLYREAADGYLKEGDTTNATRCYANALDEGGPGALAVNTTDTWLFLAIKQARMKERERCEE